MIPLQIIERAALNMSPNNNKGIPCINLQLPSLSSLLLLLLLLLPLLLNYQLTAERGLSLVVLQGLWLSSMLLLSDSIDLMGKG